MKREKSRAKRKTEFDPVYFLQGVRALSFSFSGWSFFPSSSCSVVVECGMQHLVRESLYSLYICFVFCSYWKCVTGPKRNAFQSINIFTAVYIIDRKERKGEKNKMDCWWKELFLSVCLFFFVCVLLLRTSHSTERIQSNMLRVCWLETDVKSSASWTKRDYRWGRRPGCLT